MPLKPYQRKTGCNANYMSGVAKALNANGLLPAAKYSKRFNEHGEIISQYDGRVTMRHFGPTRRSGKDTIHVRFILSLCGKNSDDCRACRHGRHNSGFCECSVAVGLNIPAEDCCDTNQNAMRILISLLRADCAVCYNLIGRVRLPQFSSTPQGEYIDGQGLAYLSNMWGLEQRQYGSTVCQYNSSVLRVREKGYFYSV